MTITIILLISTIACAIGWFLQNVATKTLALWISGKNLSPSDPEIRACAQEVWRRFFRIK